VPERVVTGYGLDDCRRGCAGGSRRRISRSTARVYSRRLSNLGFVTICWATWCESVLGPKTWSCSFRRAASAAGY
jgi:hypothetical protein